MKPIKGKKFRTVEGYLHLKCDAVTSGNLHGGYDTWLRIISVPYSQVLFLLEKDEALKVAEYIKEVFKEE